MNAQTNFNNPKNIDGLLLWNNGKPIEIGHNENQCFQEWPGSVELWEQLEDGRIMRVKRWLKKSITHFVINNEFVLKF